MLTRLNFRDVGGMPLPAGGTIRTGLIYRSGVFQKMSRNDRLLLEKLNIRRVVDLRSMEEQERRPSMLPGERRISMPCAIESLTRDRLRPLFFKRHANELIIEVIDGVYAEMVDMMLEPMAGIAHLILDPDALPLIMHCRAGKDRTGFAAAMIQWLLGARRDQIFADYLRSNEFMIPHINRGFWKLRLITAGLFPKGNLQAAFEVRREYLQTAIDKVEQEYGGVEEYFIKGGITPEELEKIREILIVK